MKNTKRLALSCSLFAAAVALTSCEGLTLASNPDGSISGSYKPPLAKPLEAVPTEPVIVPAK